MLSYRLLPLSTFTGFKGFKSIIDSTKTTLDSVAPVILNVASAIMGILFVWKLIRTVAAQQAGEGQQTEIRDYAVFLLGTILLLQVVKVVFFK